MTSPARVQETEPIRRDDENNDVAARSGRFKVRIDAFGRIIPQVLPVEGDEEDKAEGK